MVHKVCGEDHVRTPEGEGKIQHSVADLIYSEPSRQHQSYGANRKDVVSAHWCRGTSGTYLNT